jgi:hypothetical protein
LLWKFIVFLHLAVAAVITPAAAGQHYQELPAADASAFDDPAPSAPSHLLAEVVKQAAEQPLHFAMSAGPIWLSRCLTAVPWYGWVVVPALAYREWRQWPSKRWWDPALDAAFLMLGVLAATWSQRAVPGPFLRPAMIRRPLPAQQPLPKTLRPPERLPACLDGDGPAASQAEAACAAP